MNPLPPSGRLPCPALPGRQPPAFAPGARRAFTILELMLAITIFGMVMAAIYASWSAILRASKAGQVAAAAAQRSRIAARTIEDALVCAVQFQGSPANRGLYSFEADTSGDFAALSFVARLPTSFPGSGYFHDLNVRRVTFYVDQAAGGRPELLLSQSPILQTNSLEDVGTTVVLARDINLFALEFWDANRRQWVVDWLSTNQLPKLVRFALAFGERTQGQVRPEDMLVRTVDVPSKSVSLAAQGAQPGAGGGAPPPPGAGVPPPGAGLGGPRIGPGTGGPGGGRLPSDLLPPLGGGR